ncbi:replication initiator RepC [Salipiger bermudensis]|uniref:plasmid replication protein RepC n=1 Tax=Salipiger bermudensis TaxID=344736 RepID=UPI001C991783|nr:plasmid replication protein RepC [Salipiger bermudensis]MBY6005183.1 replication initiator RepC [Salipiger bermudensis]
MENTSRPPFGRPVSACLPSSEASQRHTPPMPDKWALLRDLTTGAEAFGLGHRTLSVLKALLTFWPERELPDAPESAIVFPSNRVLAERLSGMPESTLRRHLAKLVETGIVSRHDSPNCKRYARGQSGSIGIAFGFDLSPLARHASALASAAESVTAQRERIAVLRARLGMLRHRLTEDGAADVLIDAARLMLRRRASEQDLTELVSRLEAALPAPETVEPKPGPVAETTKMSASAARNERHIQETDNSISDSESAMTSEALPAESVGSAEKVAAITVPMITEACREYQAFFPDQPRGWHDLIAMSHRLAPMLGIDPPVLHEAQRIMGAERAAATVLCLLERASEIRKPGAYLRRLTQVARKGSFSVSAMLAAAGRRAAMPAFA